MRPSTKLRQLLLRKYKVLVVLGDSNEFHYVIMAQCYARNAVNGGMAETLKRLRLYETKAGVDWVQFEAPHSVQEIERARKAVKGPFSAMKGQLPRALTLEEHGALKLNAAWYTFLPDLVLKTSAWSFLETFQDRGIGAWFEFLEKNPDTPFTGGKAWNWDATGMTELTKLQARYLSGKKRR